jgi:nucleotidyltransferase substrate binding protein (TIGR01987 family)
MNTINDLLIKAIELQNQGHIAESVRLFTEVLNKDPYNAAALYSLAVISANKGESNEALALAERCMQINKGHVLVWFLHGTILEKLGREAEALISYENALKIDPGHIDTNINMSSLLHRKRRLVDALVCVEAVLKNHPYHEKALVNRGMLLEMLKQIEDAVKTFEYLVGVNHEAEYALGKLCYARLQCCDWRYYEHEISTVIARVRSGMRTCDPLSLMAISGSAEDHFYCARTFTSQRFPLKSKLLWQGERYQHERIRIAYISVDFREHPVGHALAGVIERHDSTKFETFGISFGIDDGSSLRNRFMKAFGRFIDVIDMNPAAIAELLRSLEIDIAIDLAGYTGDARPEIFTFRPAPIQVNFLGFPGTLGGDFMDYILVDRQVVPESDQRFYTEKVFYLPHAYLPVDGGLKIAERIPTREEMGLPPQGFVFCAFNVDYKMNPPVFDVWMRILTQVEGSVLWLMMRNEATRNNLQQEASKRGVDPARLVFASRIPALEDHLARYQLADLFLDTTPYNAHTTAADALFVGLPVLTCRGHSFASRVASSLLYAIGLPELITDHLTEYEQRAVQLAKDPSLLATIREKLKAHRATYPLFDTDRYCRDLEQAYLDMMKQQAERWTSLPAGSVIVPPTARPEELHRQGFGALSEGVQSTASWIPALNHYGQALSLLTRAVQLHRQRPLSELEQQGLIQVFECTHEFAWNLMKDYLAYQGNIVILGARDATDEAFRISLIADREVWLEMIEKRHLLFQTVLPETAYPLIERIVTLYYEPLLAFEKKMRELIR